MKRFSLKLKLTAMYSFFMVLVTCLCLAVLFSLSGNEILTSAQMHLRERVQESADEIELEDGEFEIDSDFYSLDNNVYLALYDTGGNFLYGKVPPGLEQAPQFEDGKIQTVKSGTEQWYVYDVQYEMENGQEFYIRGCSFCYRDTEGVFDRSPICGDFTAFDCDFNGADRVSFDQANASSGTADDRDRTGDSKRRRFKPQDRSQSGYRERRILSAGRNI